MYIIFHKIRLHHFMSFEDAEINFENYNGYISIIGINNNPLDSAKSNGSGKSALLDSICYALTGETIRGVKDIKNVFLDGDAEVELWFSVDGEDYRLIRTKGKSSNLKLFVNGQDKSGKGIKDTQEILESMLPDITAQMIGSVIILGQGLPQRFSNNTPSGRKAVLENLAKTDYMIEELKNKVANRKSELQSEIDSYQKDKYKAEAEKQKYEELILSSQHQIDAMKPKEVIEAGIEIQQLSIDKLTKQQAECTERYNETMRVVSELRDKYRGVEFERDKEVNQITIAYQDKLTSYKTEFANKNAEFNALDKQIRSIESIRDICPTCGQKLHNVVKPSCEKEKEERKQLSLVIDRLQSDMKGVEKEKQKEINAIMAKYQSKLEDVKNDGVSAKQKNLTAEQELNRLNSDIVTANSKMASMKSELSFWENNVAQWKKNIAIYGEKATECERSIENIDKSTEISERRISIVKKFDTALSRDFRGYLLTNVIDYINKITAEYSEVVLGGENKVCLSLDKNNLDIYYGEKVYECLSGGERQKVDVIVQFAIREMLCKFMGFGCNLIVLDEIFDNCDSQGCGKIIDLISQKLSDISSVYLITHHAEELNLPCDYQIQVVKGRDNISRIA